MTRTKNPKFVLFFPEDWTKITAITKAIEYGEKGYTYSRQVDTRGDYSCLVLSKEKITRKMAQLFFDSVMCPDDQEYLGKVG